MANTRWIVVQGNTPLLAASDTILAGDVVRVVIRAPWHTPLVDARSPLRPPA